ncbi:hypothetical protein T4B_8122 [Trichinella pseudospiralis]|uniref:Uncharacterized protein n=1 Tax=Trichinella pseudospiralis TaxID=6337 RepID=A0A0V1GKL0_TRIPS|nr:hypothetical protein T4B_8122 [Trichinella pseudospiralis]
MSFKKSPNLENKNFRLFSQNKQGMRILEKNYSTATGLLSLKLSKTQ